MGTPASVANLTCVMAPAGKEKEVIKGPTKMTQDCAPAPNKAVAALSPVCRIEQVFSEVARQGLSHPSFGLSRSRLQEKCFKNSGTSHSRFPVLRLSSLKMRRRLRNKASHPPPPSPASKPNPQINLARGIRRASRPKVHCRKLLHTSTTRLRQNRIGRTKQSPLNRWLVPSARLRK